MIRQDGIGLDRQHVLGDTQTNLRKRLLTGSVWNLVAMSLNQGSTLASNVIVARILGRMVFGQYTTLQTTLLTFVALFQVSMGLTASKYIAELRCTCPERVSRIVGLCGSIALVAALSSTAILFALAPWLASSALKSPSLLAHLRIGCVFLGFSIFTGFQIGVLAGLEAYFGLAKAGAISGVVFFVLVLLGAANHGLSGAMFGLTLSAVIGCIAHFLVLRREFLRLGIRVRLDGFDKEIDVIQGFAIPACVSAFFSLPAIWIAQAVLVRMPRGFEQMGLYSAATNVRLLVLFIPSVVSTVCRAIVNSEYGSGDPNRYYRAYRINLLAVSATAAIALTIAQVCSNWTLRIFGPSFAQGQPVLRILLYSTIPESLTIALFPYILSQGRIWLAFFALNLPRETLFVLLSLWLTPKLGARGLATSYLIVNTFALVSCAILVRALARNFVFPRQGSCSDSP